MIEKSIKDGIKIYQKRPRTDNNKRIINNSNKVIKGIELFKSMIDNDEFKIHGEYYAKPNNNNLEQKLTNDILKRDLIKDLERHMFGEDIESIEPEEKYEESIAERVKTRRQNTQRTFAPSSPSKKDYSAETANSLKYMEEQKKGQKI